MSARNLRGLVASALLVCACDAHVDEPRTTQQENPGPQPSSSNGFGQGTRPVPQTLGTPGCSVVDDTIRTALVRANVTSDAAVGEILENRLEFTIESLSESPIYVESTLVVIADGQRYPLLLDPVFIDPTESAIVSGALDTLGISDLSAPNYSARASVTGTVSVEGQSDTTEIRSETLWFHEEAGQLLGYSERHMIEVFGGGDFKHLGSTADHGVEAGMELAAVGIGMPGNAPAEEHDNAEP